MTGTPSDLEPWQMRRAAFHAGRNLHGSAADPRLGRASAGDQSGFFTTDQESHALFYANSDERNRAANQGDVYAALPPARPLDLRRPDAPVLAQGVIHAFETLARILEDDYLDGRSQANPHRFVRAVAELRRVADPYCGARRFDGALRNAALEYGRFDVPDAPGFDTSLLNRLLREAGFDAMISEETNQATGESAVVTIYVDRPADLISHREAVGAAHAAGLPVPAEVLAEYGIDVPEVRPSRGRRSP